MTKLIMNKSISNGVSSVTSSVARSLFLLSALAGLLLSNCDECADCGQNDAFMVTPQSLPFSKIPGNLVLKNTFNVSSSMDWILVGMPEGFTFDVTTGGPGLTKVTVTLTDYNSDAEATVKAVAANGAEKTVTLTVVYPRIPPLPPTPPAFEIPANPYAGAFWRKNQTGERIIRVENVYATADNRGPWRAYVAWYDGRWGTDRGVVLSKEMVDEQSLADRNISFNTVIPDAAVSDAENFQIAGYEFQVEGEVTAQNPDIIFRIGLKSKYTPTAQYPARYALVHIEYANGRKFYKVYLRQGEDADYLMRPGDPDESGNPVANNRAFARKFSPYNLTDPDKGTPTAFITTGNPNNGLPVNGGGFVEFPTQVGHYFRFNYNRQAFGLPLIESNPIANNLVSGYNGVGFWDPALHETCPIGWHRPQEGNYLVYNTQGNVEESEFRQSLWLNPPIADNSDATNSIIGHYADGFFDRRQIVHIWLLGYNKGYSGVSFLTINGAARGNLFFNPATHASLFFPSGGNVTNILENAGGHGLYHSATASSAGGNWILIVQTWGTWGNLPVATYNQPYMSSISYIRSQALMVRCVKDE